MPHARTLRNAREQVKTMVAIGFSAKRIKQYLKQWALWWVGIAETWDIEALLSQFIETCWQLPIAAIAEGLRQHHRTTSLCTTTLMTQVDCVGVAA